MTWWRHQMETFSALLALCARNSPVTDEFPAQKLVMQGFDVFFKLRLNKRLGKQSWGWWSERLSRPLWRHCIEMLSTAWFCHCQDSLHEPPYEKSYFSVCLTLNVGGLYEYSKVRSIPLGQASSQMQSTHYSDVIVSAMTYQITGVSIVCPSIGSDADKKTLKLRVTGLCEGNPPVTSGIPSQRVSNTKRFPFDDVIMLSMQCVSNRISTSLQHSVDVAWIWRLCGYMMGYILGPLCQKQVSRAKTNNYISICGVEVFLIWPCHCHPLLVHKYQGQRPIITSHNICGM